MFFGKKALLAVLTAWLSGSYAHAQIARGTWLVAGTMGFSHKAQEQNAWNETPATNTLRLKPRLGYFISDKLATGVHFGYAHTSEKTTAPAYSIAPNMGYSVATFKSELTRKHNEYTAGLFVQRYWLLGGQVRLFIQGDGAFTGGVTRSRVSSSTTQPAATMQYWGSSPAGYPIGIGYGGTPAAGTSTIQNFSANESTQVTSRLAFSLSPGIVYLVTQRLGLNLMMGEAALKFKSTRSMGPSEKGLQLDTYGLDLGMNTLQAGFQFHL